MSPRLGAYVLHALETAEERTVAHHLAGCDECLEEVAGLARTASLLALVRPADAEMLDDLGPAAPPPAPSADDGAGRRSAMSRVPRRAMLAAAAAVLVGTTAGPATHLLDGRGQPSQTVVLHGTGPAPSASAEVRMVSQGGDTVLHLALAGAPRRGWCSLVARATDGRSEIAATWPADGDRRVAVSGTTHIPAAELRALSVVTGTGRHVVTIPVPHQNA